MKLFKLIILLAMTTVASASFGQDLQISNTSTYDVQIYINGNPGPVVAAGVTTVMIGVPAPNSIRVEEVNRPAACFVTFTGFSLTTVANYFANSFCGWTASLDVTGTWPNGIAFIVTIT